MCMYLYIYIYVVYIYLCIYIYTHVTRYVYIQATRSLDGQMQGPHDKVGPFVGVSNPNPRRRRSNGLLEANMRIPEKKNCCRGNPVEKGPLGSFGDTSGLGRHLAPRARPARLSTSCDNVGSKPASFNCGAPKDRLPPPPFGGLGSASGSAAPCCTWHQGTWANEAAPRRFKGRRSDSRR